MFDIPPDADREAAATRTDIARNDARPVPTASVPDRSAEIRKPAGKRPEPVSILARPGESWSRPRWLKFTKRADPTKPGSRQSRTGRVVRSRDEIETIILSEAATNQRYGIRARTVAGLFLDLEQRRNPKAAQFLRSALKVFLRVVGDKALSQVSDEDGLRIRERIENRLVILPSARPVKQRSRKRIAAAEAVKQEGHTAPQKKTKPASPSQVYAEMLALRHLFDFGMVQGFTDHDPISEQVKKVIHVWEDPLDRDLPPTMEELEPLRAHADVEERVVFDMARWGGATERQQVELEWDQFDPLSQRIFERDTVLSSRDRPIGLWKPLRPQAAISMCLLRVKRYKQGRAGEPRVFQHWSCHKAALRAIRAIQFKHDVTEAVRAGRTFDIDEWGDPTDYAGGHGYKAIRLSSGRTAAENGANRYRIARLTNMSCVNAVDRVYGSALIAKALQPDRTITKSWIVSKFGVPESEDDENA